MIKNVLFQGDSITDARRDREAPDGDSSRIGYGYVAPVAAKAGDNLKILRDGVHPTLLGAQIIADQWLKIVDL